MNKRTAYWVATGLLAAELIGGGLVDAMRSDALFGAMTTLKRLGYPDYIAIILGVWKLLGAAAILAPRFPILKEWAYAGITFEMSGALFSNLWAGDRAKDIVASLAFLAIAAISWALRPESRRVRGSI